MARSFTVQCGFQARRADLADLLSGDSRVLQDQRGEIAFAGDADVVVDLRRRAAVPDGGNFRGELFDLGHVFQVAVVEADPAFGLEMFHQGDGLGDAVHLGLQRNARLRLRHDEPQNLFERENPLRGALCERLARPLAEIGGDVDGLQFVEGRLGDDEIFVAHTAGGPVMQDDELTVAGAEQVDFDPVRAEFERAAECGERALGKLARVAAMGRDSVLEKPVGGGAADGRHEAQQQRQNRGGRHEWPRQGVRLRIETIVPRPRSCARPGGQNRQRTVDFPMFHSSAPVV